MTTRRKDIFFGTCILIVLLGMAIYKIRELRYVPSKRQPETTLLQIRTMAAFYYTQNGSYPYSYGLVKPEFAKEHEAGKLESKIFQTEPYTNLLGIHDDEGFLDQFSEIGYDTDGDEQISILEYLPIGEKEVSKGTYKFTDGLYRPDAITPAVQHELNLMQKAEKRPFVYLAVNKAQAKLAATYWIAKGDLLAETWDKEDPILRDIKIPAPKLDAFVLLASKRGGGWSFFGAEGNTGGILLTPSKPKQPLNIAELYHVTTLRAFFLATRDLDEDGTPDLSFQGRKTRGKEYKVGNTTTRNELPNGHANGPYVFAYGWD